MSRKKNVPAVTGKTRPAIPRKYVLVTGVVLAICIAVIAGLVLTHQGPWAPGTAATTTTNATATFQSAGLLYSKSVDLANAGSYQEALADADAALAENVSSLNPLIQSNRAGILVELGRYNDAIDAADAAINAQGNLTTLRAVAYYNKANALHALGRYADADAAYANASALDPTLKHP
ncbi:hypothetical protein [Methanoregula sp.]|uniref:hypothetical protein n=1 Tax=Methanoregula sp. TaxID=2052170 RepID=UPI002CAAF8F1|nr:hypothetical protein [Methanoregula sp.]HVP96713.1 hypothetical protein [Methanoregula sp.]